MQFHFIRIQRGGYATVSDPNSTPRVLCFKTPVHANKYINYLSRYRSKFGKWPIINLGKPVTTVRIDQKFKHRDPEEVMKFILMETKALSDLDQMSMTSGISYFYCHDFEYDEANLMSLSIRGQDIDGAIDETMYKEWLEYNIKNG